MITRKRLSPTGTVCYFMVQDRFTGYHDWDEKHSYAAWLPKFSVLQKWNEQLSTYLNISKGYKAGGYNIISNEMTTQVVELEYDKESLWNYELGAKYFSVNGRFNMNGALFTLIGKISKSSLWR